jgi:hypothetical protein
MRLFSLINGQVAWLGGAISDRGGQVGLGAPATHRYIFNLRQPHSPQLLNQAHRLQLARATPASGQLMQKSNSLFGKPG